MAIQTLLNSLLVEWLIRQVRDFVPIGMLEFWNIGIMGSGIMEWWD
jgi:hypothetical protein